MTKIDRLLIGALVLGVCLCPMLLGKGKARISVDGDLHVIVLSLDYLTRTETTEDASSYADEFFLELEECDGFLLSPKPMDADYAFRLGGYLTWHPGEIKGPLDEQDYTFPYEMVSGTVWINIWDVTDKKRPATLEQVEAGGLLGKSAVLELIKNVVTDACAAMKEELHLDQ